MDSKAMSNYETQHIKWGRRERLLAYWRHKILRRPLPPVRLNND